MKNRINIFCCSTKYHMLLSGLLAYKKRAEKNILVVEHSGFKGEEALTKDYTYKLFDEVHLLYYPVNEMPHKTDYFFYKHSVTSMIETDCPALKAYRHNSANVQCYLCEDGHHFARYFVYNFPNVVMLEDGMQIYKPYVRYESTLKQWFKYQMLGIIRPNGRDKRIKELWVQYPKKLPKDTAEKGRELHLKPLLDNISGTDHLLTLESMLGFDDQVLNKVKKTIQNTAGTPIVLLITQPLAEDGLITMHEKRKIYSEMLGFMEKPYTLIIKPHPRETTDYSSWFDNAIILNNGFPLEMILFICEREEKPIDWAVTVDSTAVMNISEVCKHVKAFGLCELTSELSKKYPLTAGFEL